MNRRDRPLVALTMGDPAGVGPELIAKAWADSPLLTLAQPLVIGSSAILAKAVDRFAPGLTVQTVTEPESAEPAIGQIPCLDVDASMTEMADIQPSRVDSKAGRSAYDALIAAIDLALAGRVEAITTLPLNKEALHAAGIAEPGHTEILAHRCQVPNHAMMLYLPPSVERDHGLGVVHVTLHVALRRVFELLTTEAVRETIRLADQAIRPLLDGRAPRVAVCGLNPHAGEHGLFGDEEGRIIEPGVEQARRLRVDVCGPIAADTLFTEALGGRFDVVVAMYHDQGHVALKTIGFDQAVNVTLGLPIVRTSVAHGTAFDIAWQGKARTESLIAAVRVASKLVAGDQQFLGLPPTLDDLEIRQKTEKNSGKETVFRPSR